MSQEHPKDERRRPLVSVEFQTEIDISTAVPERRMFLKMYFDARDSGLLADIGDRRWRTLCALATYMDEKGLCYPSQSRIAKDLATTRESVNRRIQELLKYRFQGRPVINIQKARLNTTHGGRWTNNVYQILPVTGLQIFGDDTAPKSEPPENLATSAYVTESSHRPVCPEPNIGFRHTNQSQRVNQKVVNALPNNDHKNSPERDQRTPPQISDRALRATYGLNDAQIGQVHYLVEKQITLLGAGIRNHGNYVKRAAEALANGNGQLLDVTLSDYKQAATTISVATPPAFFKTMWDEARQRHPNSSPAAEVSRSSNPIDLAPLTATLASTMEPPAEDPMAAKIARMIEDAVARGFVVPESIRRSSHYGTVARWWAALNDQDKLERRRGGAP